MTSPVYVSPVARVLDALERMGCSPRKTAGGWQARCPAHEDQHPSLTISEGRDGRVLLHCFAGCDFEGILQALELGVSELFAPDRHGACNGIEARGDARRATQRDKRRPPEHQVRSLWARCHPLDQDREASAWAGARGLDPSTIADRDLCRVLPADAIVPRWAWIKGAPWSRDGYRIVFPMFDSRGQSVSLHARNVRPEADPKGAMPAGYAIGGLILADAAGRAMLMHGTLDGVLWVVEGAPDFLVTATAWGDAADPAPAVLGLIAGSWTTEIAVRVPNGARVVVAVHHDKAGEAYAARVAEALGARVTLERWAPVKGRAAS